MVGSRTATALVGLVVSLLASALLWWYFDTLAVFLVVPFVPLLLGRRSEDDEPPALRTCPDCGFRTAEGEFEYCPRDGTELER